VILSDDLNWAVIVAMTVMGMMQATVDEITDVITVRHCFMSAAQPVNMIRIMAKLA
jgi:hypothetical protein